MWRGAGDDVVTVLSDHHARDTHAVSAPITTRCARACLYQVTQITRLTSKASHDKHI